jgi:hypothetical protein
MNHFPPLYYDDPYHSRQFNTWIRLNFLLALFEPDATVSAIDAGYCLDAVPSIPRGGMHVRHISRWLRAKPTSTLMRDLP